MSTDNWRGCPKCAKEKKALISQRIARVEKQYGKIPSDEYIILFNKTKMTEETSVDFREDFEIYSEGTTIYINYSGYCKKCKFKTHFEKTEEMKL